MATPTQYERYKRLVEYLDNHVGEDITPELIESLCFYSYRNINRIFHTLNNETIGQYIKRLRMEKAAEYLKYSKSSVTEIANKVGVSDTASVSKAFKKMLGSSPSSYRETVIIKQEMNIENITPTVIKPIEYELVERSDLNVVYSQYKGSYENIAAMSELWNRHIRLALKNNLLNSSTQYLAEILDDNEITSSLNCRYNAVISVDEAQDFESDGVLRRKTIPGGWYAKFNHHGSHASSKDTYDRIYGQWIQYIGLELDDKAIIEIYVNDDGKTPEDQLLTEIYVPVIAENS